jgi:hypothetical protein
VTGWSSRDRLVEPVEITNERRPVLRAAFVVPGAQKQE